MQSEFFIFITSLFSNLLSLLFRCVKPRVNSTVKSGVELGVKLAVKYLQGSCKGVSFSLLGSAYHFLQSKLIEYDGISPLREPSVKDIIPRYRNLALAVITVCRETLMEPLFKVVEHLIGIFQ